MSDELQILGLVGGLAGPFLAYVAAARRFSGKIATTEAHDLWEESRAIREWSQERIRELRRAHEECETQLAQANRRIAALETKA